MLIILSTPIGNIDDISLRAIKILKNTKFIACEDTRVTKKLFGLINIKLSSKLISYNDKNAEKIRPKLINILDKNDVVLVSDSGTPLISDPGFKLVKLCHEKQIKVTSIPGACSPIAALTLSGIPSDRFIFNGFFPRKNKNAIEIINETIGLKVTQIWFESPNRLLKTLNFLRKKLGNRRCAVLRELTKIHEEISIGNLNDLIEKYSNIEKIRGEIIIVVEGSKTKEKLNEKIVISMFSKKLKKMKMKEAVKEISVELGYNKNQIYKIGINLLKNMKSE